VFEESYEDGGRDGVAVEKPDLIRFLNGGFQNCHEAGLTFRNEAGLTFRNEAGLTFRVTDRKV